MVEEKRFLALGLAGAKALSCEGNKEKSGYLECQEHSSPKHRQLTFLHGRKYNH